MTHDGAMTVVGGGFEFRNVQDDLRRFVYETVVGLHPDGLAGAEDVARRQLKQWRFRSLDACSLGQLFRLLFVDHYWGSLDDEPRLYGRRVRHWQYLAAAHTRGLRNKYEHDGSVLYGVPPREQLADLLLVHRFVDAVCELAGRELDGAATLRASLDVSIARCTARVRCEGGVDFGARPEDGETIRRLEGAVADATREATRLQGEIAQLTAVRAVERSAYRDALSAGAARAHDGAPAPVSARAAPEARAHTPSPEADARMERRLIALRTRVQRELGVGASADGLLRKRMIGYFVAHRIRNLAEYRRHVPAIERTNVAPGQLAYLPHVFAAVARDGASVGRQ